MPETSKDRPVVMVSSTALDLPEHRKEVMDACLRMGMHPVMMEHLSAGDTSAAEKSMAMVDDAAIYLGETGDGIRVFDQWNGHKPSERTIHYTGKHAFVDSGANYYVAE